MTTNKSFADLDVCENNESDINTSLLEKTPNDQMESPISSLQHEQTPEATSKLNSNDSFKKQESQKLNSAVWTTHATSTLVKLYEAKLEMLETPKKKTRIWIAISENLKDHNIDVTPDQVRWKINALTKKYKRCIDIGKHEKFKYFKEMDNIYAKYNFNCNSYSITELISKNKLNDEITANALSKKPIPETRAMITMRKARLASKIDCDRFQGKIKLERQWLEYLHRKEEQKKWRDKVFEKNLKLREQKLETWKKELELKESLEYKKLQLIEKEQEELLQIEREKCELLKQFFCQNLQSNHFY